MKPPLSDDVTRKKKNEWESEGVLSNRFFFFKCEHSGSDEEEEEEGQYREQEQE